jgi:hypothetical protein
MGAYELVWKAIIEKSQIVAVYDGHRREMCPHVIGLNKQGEPQALAFQFAGGSSKGLPPGGQWRCLKIDKLSDVTVRAGDWHTGTDHKRPQTCVDEIDVEVDY